MFELTLLKNIINLINNGISLNNLSPEEIRELLKIPSFNNTEEIEEEVKALTMDFVAKYGTIESIYILMELMNGIQSLKNKYRYTRTEHDLVFLYISCRNSRDRILKLYLPWFAWIMYKHLSKVENGSFDREVFVLDMTKNFNNIFSGEELVQESFYEVAVPTPSINTFLRSTKSYKEMIRQIKKSFSKEQLGEYLYFLYQELCLIDHKYNPILLTCARNLIKDIKKVDKGKRGNVSDKQLTMEATNIKL